MIVSFGFTTAGTLRRTGACGRWPGRRSPARPRPARSRAPPEMVDHLAPRRVALVEVRQRQLRLHAAQLAERPLGAAQDVHLEALNVELEEHALAAERVPERVEPRGRHLLRCPRRRTRARSRGGARPSRAASSRSSCPPRGSRPRRRRRTAPAGAPPSAGRRRAPLERGERVRQRLEGDDAALEARARACAPRTGPRSRRRRAAGRCARRRAAGRAAGPRARAQARGRRGGARSRAGAGRPGCPG